MSSGEEDMTDHSIIRIIFQLYLDSLPWASGGEYLRFYRLTRKLIEAWRKVGIEPFFVFDGEPFHSAPHDYIDTVQGPAPPEKHDQIIERLESHLFTSRLFHTTSPASRSTFSFSRHRAILPCLSLHTFIHALRSLDVKYHVVPCGEADVVTVSIANQLGAYVMGKDSDFLILISGPGAEQVRGYCPLDMLEWIGGAVQENASWTIRPEWTVAQSKRSTTFHRQSTFLPTSSLKDPTLVLTVITASAFRSRLRLPPSHYPLLASLAGNDYVPFAYSKELFNSALNSNQRIELVARIVREQYYSPNAGEQGSSVGDRAVEIVIKTLRKLCDEGGAPYVTQTTIDGMVNTIIDSTLQYVLPSIEDCCPTYPYCDHHLSTKQLSDQEVTETAVLGRSVQLAREVYADARRKGFIPTVNHAYVYPSRIYPWLVNENPSGPSSFATSRHCKVREEAWTIIDHSLGGLCWPAPTEDEIAQAKEDKELRELLGVEVDEVDREEALRNLRISRSKSRDASPSKVGSAQTTSLGNSEQTTDVGSGDGMMDDWEDEGDTLLISSIPPSRRVIEYLRQGSSHRLMANIVQLPDNTDPTEEPLSLRPLPDRLRHYLKILHSDTTTLSSLPVALHPLLAAIRICILDSADHTIQAQSFHEVDRWKRGEVEAVLKAGLGMYATWRKEAKVFRPRKEAEESMYPVLHSRPCQIVAQLTAAIMDAQVLAQALLLTPDLEPPTTLAPQDGEQAPTALPVLDEVLPLTHLTPFMFVSGVSIHSLLSGMEPPPATGWSWTLKDDELLDRCLHAVLEGLESKLRPTRMESSVIPVDHDSPSDGDHSDERSDDHTPVKIQKKKKKSRTTGGRGLEKKASGRFGPLEEMTI